MKEDNEDLTEDESTDICWRAIPIEYSDFEKEISDNYDGCVFGHLEMFESPHFLYRRFHKNYCKAIALTKLQSYSLKYSEENNLTEWLESEIKEHSKVNFDLQILSFHQALVLIISAFEAFVKDFFAETLRIQNRNLGEKSASQIIRKYSFQNTESINKAFKWLFNDDTIVLVSDCLNEALQMRHKIVHESYYNSNFNMAMFNKLSFDCLKEAHYVDVFFEDNGLYKYIKPNV